MGIRMQNALKLIPSKGDPAAANQDLTPMLTMIGSFLADKIYKEQKIPTYLRSMKGEGRQKRNKDRRNFLLKIMGT